MSSSSRRKQAGIFAAGTAIGTLISTAVANADAVRQLAQKVAVENGLAERELPNDGNAHHPLPQIGDDARVSSLTPGMSSGGHSSSVNPMDSAVLSGGLNPTKTMIGGDADAKLPPPPAPDQPAQPPKPVSHVLVSSNSQASLTEITQLADELDKTKTALATSGGGAGGGGSIEAGGTTAGGTTTTATVQIAVGAAAPAPVTTTPLVAGDDAGTTGHNGTLNVDAAHGLLANDHLGSAGGTLIANAGTYATAQGGQVVIAADGSYSYTPANGYSGADTFTYTVSDGQGGTATATVQIAVGAAAPAPVTTVPLVAGDDAYAVGHDAPLNVDAAHGVLANDHLGSAGGNLAVTAGTYATAQGGQVVIAANGSFAYTPANGFTGGDSVTVTVSDGMGGTATSTVSFAVQAAPVQVPVATNHAPVVDADHTTSTVVLGRQAGSTAQGQIDFDDGDGDTMTLSLVGGDPAGAHVDLMPDGRYMVTRTAYETAQVQFTVRADDGHGGVTDTVVTVDLPPNQAPYAVNNTLAVAHNASGIGDIGILDPEGAGVTAAKASDPANGTVTVNADGTYTYVPNAGFGGQDTFDVTITDVEGLSSTVTVIVDVGYGIAPTASNTWAATGYTAPLNGDLGLSDPDNSGALRATMQTAPAHGTLVVNPDGTYTYTPDTDKALFGGQASYDAMAVVTVTDAEGLTQDVTLTLHVTDDMPVVAGNDNITVNYHDSTTIDLNALYTPDPNGDSLVHWLEIDGDVNTIDALPAGFSLSNGILTISGGAQFTGSLGFSDGIVNGSNVDLHVVHDNAAPEAVVSNPVAWHAKIYVDLDSNGSLDLNSGFTDGDGDSLTYRLSFDNEATWLSEGDALPAGVTWSGSTVTFDPGLSRMIVYVEATDGYGGAPAVSSIQLDHNFAPTFDAGSSTPIPVAADDTVTIMTTSQLLYQLGIADGNDDGDQQIVSFDNVSGGTIEDWAGDGHSWAIHSGSAGAITADVHVTDPYGAHLDVTALHIADAT